MYLAPHVRPNSPYVVGAEVMYSYADLVMKMKRVHEQGLVDNLKHKHELHSGPPPGISAEVPLKHIDVKLFRWAWLVFLARQKRLYNWWCARCGPYPNALTLDVCHGVQALRRSVTHNPSEVSTSPPHPTPPLRTIDTPPFVVLMPHPHPPP